MVILYSCSCVCARTVPRLTSNSACLWMSSALCRLRINSASLATRTRWSFMVWLSSLRRAQMDISSLENYIHVFKIIIQTFYTKACGCQFISVIVGENVRQMFSNIIKSWALAYLKHLFSSVISGNLGKKQPCNIHKMLRRSRAK